MTPLLALENGLPHTWLGFVSACSLAGLIIGFVISWFATKNERKAQKTAHAETNRVYEQTIAAQKEFIQTSEATHEATIKRLTDLHERQLTEMTCERDTYRTKSHDLAGELQAVGLQLKEFELRPDLTTLYHAQQAWHEQRERFYKEMFATQQAMQENLKDQGEVLKNLLATAQTIAQQVARLATV